MATSRKSFAENEVFKCKRTKKAWSTGQCMAEREDMQHEKNGWQSKGPEGG